MVIGEGGVAIRQIPLILFQATSTERGGGPSTGFSNLLHCNGFTLTVQGTD